MGMLDGLLQDKKYYTTANNGDYVEVDPSLAKQLVQSGKKNPEDFHIQEVGTAEKASNLVNKAGSFLALPVTNPATQFLEKQGGKVEGAVNDVAGRIAEKQMPMTATALSLNAGALKPSSMMVGAGMGLLGGIAAQTATPRPLRLPSTTESGFKGAIADLGGQQAKPAQLATPALNEYNQNVEQNIPAQLAGKRSAFPTTPVQSPQQVFAPKYNEVAGQISPESSTFQKSGTAAIDKHFNNIEVLRDNSNKAWAPLNEQLPKIKGDLTPAVNYVKNLFGIGDEGMGGGNVNVRLAGSSNESGIPLSIIRQQYPDYVPSDAMKTIEANNPAMPAKDYGIFAKVLRMGQNENLSAADIQAMKSYVGRNVAEHGNVLNDKFNHDALGLEKALNQSLIGSVEKTGNSDALMNAKGASKALYEYADLNTSKIMQKAKTPEAAMNRLMSSPSTVQEFFNEHNFTPEEKGQFQRAYLDKLAQKSGNDPVKFSKNLEAIPPDQKSAIFGDKVDLVNSIKDTVPQLQDEIAKTKQQLPAQTKSDILNANEMNLNKIMTNSKASELVDNIYKDGSPELAKTLNNTMSDDSMQLLRRGMIQKGINENKIPQPDGSFKLNQRGLTNFLDNMKPEFIDEFFGKGNQAQSVNSLRDATKYFTESQAKGTGNTPWSLRWAAHLKNIASNFRLNSQVNKLLTGNVNDNMPGTAFANKVAPTATYPTTINKVNPAILALPTVGTRQQ